MGTDGEPGCGACGHLNRVEARFCDACGAPLRRSCRSCGQELRPGARFCDGCGAALDPGREMAAPAADTASGTRRTVSVVFADLVGSTALQERLDVESARGVMTRFYEVMRGAVAAHGGSVDKFIGDAVVATFGADELHEDDALRAVRAAHTMREALGPLNDDLRARWSVELGMRTGVNTGEVVVEGDGVLVGDMMNTAARLEQAAPAGEVLLGEATWRLVRGRVQAEPVEPLAVKGKSERVPAWRLLDVDASAMQPEQLALSLVGREAELRSLRAVFDEAVHTRACRLATVIGAPGIGKSRLAAALTAALAGEAETVEGRCEPSGEGITFVPLAEALRAAAGIAEVDSPEVVRERLLGLFSEQDEDRTLVVERAAGVLGVGPAGPPQETFWAVRRVFEALAHRRPLVIVIDDIHWGQPMFLDLVEHLVEWVSDAPILLLALARPELRDVRDALAGPRRASAVLDLEPLDPDQSRTLVAGLLEGVELPAGLEQRVLATAEGNPLFISEMVRMLVDDGVLVREGERWVWHESAASVEVPPTISALLSARIDRLAPDERTVVARAAVIGKHFYRGAVAELSPLPVAERLDGHLEALRRREMVEPEGIYWVDEPVFRFHHVLIRDAAYRALLKEARAELHERFAEWLERKAGELVAEHEEVLGYHLEQAYGYRRQLSTLDAHGRALGTRAAERLASAGRRALQREDLSAAQNLLGRALALLEPEAGARSAVLADLAEAQLSAGDAQAAAQTVDALGERPIAAVHAAQLELLAGSADPLETAARLMHAADALAAVGDKAGEAKAHHVRAQALALRGRVAEVEATLDRALAAARAAADGRRVRLVLAAAPRAALWGPAPVARASGRCLDVMRILRMGSGARHVEAGALRCQAVLEAMRGRPDAGREVLASCRALLEELGLRLELLETAMYAGQLELIAGDAAAAERELRSARAGFEELGLQSAAGAAAALVARAVLEQDRLDDAESLACEAERLAGGDLRTSVVWRSVRARALARRALFEDAEALAREAVALADPIDALSDRADAHLALAEVLRAAGREAHGAAEARAALRLYEAKENVAGAQRARALAGDAAPAAEAVAPAAIQLDRNSANARLAFRYSQSLERGDWAAARACLTDDFQNLDRRTAPAAGSGPHDADGQVGLMRSAIETASEFRFSYSMIADVDAVCLLRLSWVGLLREGGGEFLLPALILCHRRDDQFDRIEVFDADAEGAALEAMGEAVGGEEGDGIRLLGSYVRVCEKRDWEVLRSIVADDASFIDRRLVGSGTLRGEEIWKRPMALVELSPDVRPSIRAVIAVDGSLQAAEHLITGHTADGGEIEISYLAVASSHNGQITRMEIFDVTDRAEAFRRFEELTAPARTENEQLAMRWLGSLNDGDWTAARECLAKDFQALDHRGLSPGPGPHAAEPYLRLLRSSADSAERMRYEYRIAVDVGDLLLSRVDWVGFTGGGGAFEHALLVLARRAGERLQRIDLFDVDADADALRAMGESLGDAAGRALAVLARYLDAVNARDWEELSAIWTEDLLMHDHRAGGWELEHGSSGHTKLMHGFIKLVPDIRVGISRVLEFENDLILYEHLGSGHDAGGGYMEIRTLVISRTRGARVDRVEVFEIADEDRARARFAELTGDQPLAAAAPGNAATALAQRWAAAFNAHDRGALLDCFNSSYRQADRRPGLANTIEGPQNTVDMLASTWELADFKVEVTPMRTHGERFAVSRILFSGGGSEVDMLCTWVVDAEGLVLYNDLYDPDALKIAIARMHELAAGDRAPGERPPRSGIAAAP